MVRLLLHLCLSAVIIAISALAYFFISSAHLPLLSRGDRYDLFDLLQRKPLSIATATQRPVLAQGSSEPMLRAEPVNLNNVEILSQLNRAISDLTDAVVPAVVSIDTTTNVNVSRVVPTDPFGMFGYRKNESYAAAGLGSGVIVTEQGHIITNHHVVAGVDAIRVTLHDGSQYDAEWIGSEPNVDIAVLQIKMPKGGALPTLHPLPFGDSDAVRVGEMVLAVGNPFGLSETVTQGIISAKQRELNDSANEYFQVDAVINPGNSGGPLVNVRGEIIGVNVAIFTGQEDVRVWQGIGLAIPSKDAKEVFEAIVHGKPLIRGYIGLEVDNLSPNYAIALGLNSTAGAVITNIAKGSPAEEAGLKPGDVVLQFDGKPIRNANEALSRIMAKKAGEPARLTVLRKGQTTDFTVNAIARSETNTLKLKSDIASSGQNIADALGITVANLSDAQRQTLRLPDGIPAIIISDVKIDSQAAIRFRKGDLIHRINQSPVNDVTGFYDLLGSLPQDKTSVMILTRDGRPIRAFLNP